MILCRRTFFVVAGLLTSSSLGFAANEVGTRQYNIVFLGDSLTAGYGLSASRAFPAKIQKRLDDKGMPWKVINAGVSGDTTAGGVRRLSWVYKNKVDVLFVCLGANDGFRGFSPRETEKNLKAIVERGKKEGSRVLLAGMLLPRNFGAAQVKSFESVFPRVAKDSSIPLMPFLLDGVAAKKELNLPDGIHPNDKGTEIVAEKVWSFVEPVLQDVMRAK